MRGWGSHIVSLRDVHFSSMYTTTELGRGESPLLNGASRKCHPSNQNQIRFVGWPVVLSTVKAILPEVHYSLSPCSGRYLVWDGISARMLWLSGGLSV